MKEWKIIILLANTFEEIFLYAKADSKDEALQKSLEENGYEYNEIIIKDIIEIF